MPYDRNRRNYLRDKTDYSERKREKKGKREYKIKLLKKFF